MRRKLICKFHKKAQSIGRISVFVLVASILLTSCGQQIVPVDNRETAKSMEESIQEQTTSESNNEETVETKVSRIPEPADLEMLKSRWSNAQTIITLETVQQDLDQNGITYEGCYNLSGERLNMTLEDGTELIFFHTNDPEDNRKSWKCEDRDASRYELVMFDQELYYYVFQENYLNQYDVAIDEYYYADTTQLLEEADLWVLNQTDLSILRNQIFAQYGRQFDDPFLDAIFSAKTWYEPKYTGAEFDVKQTELLNDVDRSNLKLLVEEETGKGFRRDGGADSYLTPLLSGSWLELDGDGEREQIFFSMERDQYYDGSRRLEVKDGEQVTFVEDTYVSTPLPDCYLAIVEEEKYLVLADHGPSADPSLDFYSYSAGKLKEMGSIYGYEDSLCIEGDVMSNYVESLHLQCQPVIRQYQVINGQVVEIEQEFYEYSGNTATVSADSLMLYHEKGDAEPGITLKKGDQVTILGGDLKEWVLIMKDATAETGWIKVNGMDCILPDGETVKSDSLFDGLTFYG